MTRICTSRLGMSPLPPSLSYLPVNLSIFFSSDIAHCFSFFQSPWLSYLTSSFISIFDYRKLILFLCVFIDGQFRNSTLVFWISGIGQFSHNFSSHILSTSANRLYSDSRVVLSAFLKLVVMHRSVVTPIVGTYNTLAMDICYYIMIIYIPVYSWCVYTKLFCVSVFRSHCGFSDHVAEHCEANNCLPYCMTKIITWIVKVFWFLTIHECFIHVHDSRCCGQWLWVNLRKSGWIRTTIIYCAFVWDVNTKNATLKRWSDLN